MKWTNELTAALKIDYPIIQAPMLGVTTAAMVAAISNAGGLGSLPVGGLSPAKTLTLIREVKALTTKPFAVNFFANNAPVWNEEAVAEMTAFLQRLCLKYKLEVTIPSPEAFEFFSYTNQIGILLEEKVPIVSFTFGIPGDDSIKALKDHRVILIGTATSVKEAMVLEEHGINIVTAQGIEAGGHRGTFLEGPLPQVGLMSLVPQVVNAITIPVIAAGGICNGSTTRAAMMLGAKGVQPGSAFIASDESMGIPAYKQALQNSSDTDSVLTRAFTGRWARGLRNTFIEELETASIKIPEYPIQAHLISAIRMDAFKRNDIAFANLWSGQSSSTAASKPATTILRDIVESAESLE